VKAWGTKGAGPGQFRLPHTIVQDSRGRLYVGDRCGSTSIGNAGCTDGRIEIFDTNGTFIEEWKQIDGRNFLPMSLAITKDDRLFVGDSGNGRVVILQAATAKVLDVIDGVRGIHGMALDPDENVYVASLGNGLRRYAR
jgi:DNA-binding beta-propeller fold protein YncE